MEQFAESNCNDFEFYICANSSEKNEKDMVYFPSLFELQEGYKSKPDNVTLNSDMNLSTMMYLSDIHRNFFNDLRTVTDEVVLQRLYIFCNVLDYTILKDFLASSFSDEYVKGIIDGTFQVKSHSFFMLHAKDFSKRDKGMLLNQNFFSSDFNMSELLDICYEKFDNFVSTPYYYFLSKDDNDAPQFRDIYSRNVILFELIVTFLVETTLTSRDIAMIFVQKFEHFTFQVVPNECPMTIINPFHVFNATDKLHASMILFCNIGMPKKTFLLRCMENVQRTFENILKWLE